MPARAFRLGELNRETEYVLATFGVEAPPLLEGALEEGAPVAVVDTNNPKELPDGIEHAALHSVIDHHKLAGLTSPAVPTEIDIRRSARRGRSVRAREGGGADAVPQVAGLLLSCILSDSLEFRSPTTTELDKELAIELAAIAGVDLHAHARAMLDAKAEVGHLSPTELIMMDSKQYEIGGRNLRISVVETTRPEKVLSQRAALQTAMKEVAADQKLDDVLLFVVDVLQSKRPHRCHRLRGCDRRAGVGRRRRQPARVRPRRCSLGRSRSCRCSRPERVNRRRRRRKKPPSVPTPPSSACRSPRDARGEIA